MQAGAPRGSAAFAGFVVRSQRPPVSPDSRGRVLAESAFRALRFAFENRLEWGAEAAQTLTEALDGFGPFRARSLGPQLADRAFEAELLRFLRDAFDQGRLVVTRPAVEQLSLDAIRPVPELPPLAPPPRDPGLHSFELRVIDEVGQGINGVDADFIADEPTTVSTNGAGVALLDGVHVASASVSLRDVEALARVLDPRWDKVRSGKPPKESNLTEVVFRGAELGPFPLKAEVPNTVVIKPPLGKLFVELHDRTGRQLHRKVRYTIDGPQSFSGETDEDGRLLHENVLPGDYTLSFEAPVDLGDESVDQSLETQLVVLEPEDPTPELRMLGALPRVVLARLKGMFFDTNKSFLLPASTAVFERLRSIYAENEPADLLVVGHADTTGDASVNDPLSLERADNTRAFLEDDVDTWLAMYDTSVPSKRRWGSAEDDAMVFSTADFATKPPEEDPISWFQRTRGLLIDGIAGPETRRQLITEYMALDGVGLGGDDPEFDITITTHGCGENFPLDDSGEELDSAPADDQEDQLDRRVELFFFDREFGIKPAPPGKNSGPGSTQYPQWRKRALRTSELDTDPVQILEIRLHDLDAKPLPRAVCSAKVGALSLGIKQADDDGVLRVTLPPACPVTIELSFGPEGSEEPFPLSCSLVVDCDSDDDDERDRQRLHNLGYLLEWEFETQAVRFQADYQVDADPEPLGLVDGSLPDGTRERLNRIFDGDLDASTPA